MATATSPPNMALERVITGICAGRGIAVIAVICEVSVATVYEWRRQGEVYRTQHAVKLWRAARQAGIDVTMDELAGLKPARAPLVKQQQPAVG